MSDVRTSGAGNSSPASTDRIEKRIVLKAPHSRVWQAISSADQFGEWFQVALDGEFEAGKTIRGRITYPGYEHLTVEMVIERIEPEQLFSYRWHPFAIDMTRDYSNEPMTLVEFRLQDAEGGVLLTITESGFDQIPIERRAEAREMNDGGWAEQIQNIARYVAAG